MKVSVTAIEFTKTTPEQLTWPTFDNTRLVAYNTCPVWGTVRYGHHKIISERNPLSSEGRAMPLETGSAMHEVFAWVRMCQLFHQTEDKTLAAALFKRVGQSLFGEDRLTVILSNIDASFSHDRVLYAKQGAGNVLETSGFYDNPNDKRRTLSNMELAAYAYIDKWSWANLIWVQGEGVTAFVGIELPFDIAVVVQYTDEGGKECELKARFTGRIDGIHYRADDPSVLIIGENKTAARLDDAWTQSFNLATQVTGYCIAGMVLAQTPIDRAYIFGLAIPLPKGYDYGGVISQRVLRKDYHFTQWAHWFTETAVNALTDMAKPLEATRHTHSCSRYFRPCPLVPLCDNPLPEQQRIFDDMPVDEWSPLDKPGANNA